MTAQQRPADVRVALLRGINVGCAKRVAMADLRAIVESLGYLNVRTVLNSGNVVFTVPAGRKGDAAAAIEQAIATGLGVQSRVIVITAADVCEIVTKHPLASLVDNPSRLQVLVLADPARRRSLAPLLKKTWAPEALALDRRVAYAWCPGGVATSPLMEALGRIVGNGMTARNIATMNRIDRLARVGQGCRSRAQSSRIGACDRGLRNSGQLPSTSLRPGTVAPAKLAAQGCAGAMPLYRNRCTRLPSVLSPT